MNRADSEPLDIREYLRLFKRRGWILVLCVALIPAGTYAYTERLPEVYQSAAVLQIQSSAAESSVLPGESTVATQNIQAVARYVSTSVVADAAARVLDEPEGSLLGAASASADEVTGFITITAEGSTSERAQEVADAFAEALGATRARRARRRIDTAIESIERDLGRLPADDAATRAQLNAELRRLRTLESAQSQNAAVIEPALPGVKIAPNPVRNTTVAFILAVLLGIGLMLFAERADRRVRRPEELERIVGLPLLGTVPKLAFPGEHPSSQTAEAFQTLRDSVTYFNVDEDLKSLMVISALKGEGKTTVATHLAVAYARAGKRVILVDADLRKPEVADRIGVNTAVGLSQVLVGAKLTDALREVPPFGPRLRVLGGGPVPPNPSELLGSKRMAWVIAALTKHADVVVIDTPPLLLVSDAFPLLEKVDGVLALCRLNRATREPLRKMLEVASTAGGRVLGMVATGARGRDQYAYGYGYGYGDGYGDDADRPMDDALRFEARLSQLPAKRSEEAGEPEAAGAPQPAEPDHGSAAERQREPDPAGASQPTLVGHLASTSAHSGAPENGFGPHLPASEGDAAELDPPPEPVHAGGELAEPEPRRRRRWLRRR